MKEVYMTKNKKIFVHLCSGVVAGILLIAAVSQCGDARDANKRLDKAKTENAALRDSVRKLNDSLVVARQRLADCEKGKRCVRKTSKPVAKPRPKSAAPSQPKSKPVVPAQPRADKPQPKAADKNPADTMARYAAASQSIVVRRTTVYRRSK